MEELKRCPHCGGIAVITWDSDMEDDCSYLFAECMVCGARGKRYFAAATEVFDENSNFEEKYPTANSLAAEAWNMRTPS